MNEKELEKRLNDLGLGMSVLQTEIAALRESIAGISVSNSEGRFAQIEHRLRKLEKIVL